MYSYDTIFNIICDSPKLKQCHHQLEIWFCHSGPLYCRSDGLQFHFLVLKKTLQTVLWQLWRGSWDQGMSAGVKVKVPFLSCPSSALNYALRSLLIPVQCNPLERLALNLDFDVRELNPQLCNQVKPNRPMFRVCNLSQWTMLPLFYADHLCHWFTLQRSGEEASSFALLPGTCLHD